MEIILVALDDNKEKYFALPRPGLNDFFALMDHFHSIVFLNRSIVSRINGLIKMDRLKWIDYNG